VATSTPSKVPAGTSTALAEKILATAILEKTATVENSELDYSSLSREISEITSDLNLIHKPKSGDFRWYSESIYASLNNFVTEVVFMNPENSVSDYWDYGFIFRSHYRLAVTSLSEWILWVCDYENQNTSDLFCEKISSGDINNFNKNGENKVMLIAKGEDGYLLINDEITTKLDLSSIQQGYGPELDVDLLEQYPKRSISANYSDWKIWKSEAQDQNCIINKNDVQFGINQSDGYHISSILINNLGWPGDNYIMNISSTIFELPEEVFNFACESSSDYSCKINENNPNRLNCDSFNLTTESGVSCDYIFTLYSESCGKLYEFSYTFVSH